MFVQKYKPYYTCLLMLLVALRPQAQAQNVPKDGATGPSGPVTEIPQPPLPYFWSGINYTLTSVPQVPIANISGMGAPGAADLKEKYVFRDGFNQVYETVESKVSKQGGVFQSLVQFSDTRVQRDRYDFLPVSTHYFGLINYIYQVQRDYYAARYPNEGYTSYTKTENSASQAYTTVSYAPGKSQVGQGRGTSSTRITNAAGEVRIWELDGNGKPVSTGAYNAGELFGEDITAPSDNDGKSRSRVFTDKDGRVVLKMVADSMYTYGSGVLQTGWTFQSTYYVYDDMGKLRYILPPRAVALAENSGWVLNTTRVDNLCFQYQYDTKGRLSAQRNPGEEDFTYMVYDTRQRLVLTRTPNDKAGSRYQVIYYDKQNRVIGTALLGSSSSPEAWQGAFDATPAVVPSSDIRYYMGYPQEGQMPPDGAISSHTILSYNYYDHYKTTDPGGTLPAGTGRRTADHARGRDPGAQPAYPWPGHGQPGTG